MNSDNTVNRHYTAACSDVGQQRKLNEDSYYIDESLGVILVADGMGGHNAGEVASREAVKLIYQYILDRQNIYSEYIAQTVPNDEDSDRTWDGLPNPLVELVKQAVQHTNTVLYDLNKENGYSDNQGMGTTVVGVWVQSQLDEAIIFHVGDSRAYLYRSERILQLTKDHSLYQQWLDYGQVGTEPPQNIILHAIGLTRQVTIDIKIQSLQPGDLILLCSDGLTNMVSDNDIKRCIQRSSTDSIATLCQLLTQQANQNGGSDNVTVAMSRYT